MALCTSYWPFVQHVRLACNISTLNSPQILAFVPRFGLPTMIDSVLIVGLAIGCGLDLAVSLMVLDTYQALTRDCCHDS
jgi:hypothetical protein